MTGPKSLVTERGRTTIADVVVQKIAGIAAREVAGVYDLGTGGTRAIGAVRERIPGSRGPSVTQGVSVEVGETQAAVDVDIVCVYGVSIAELAAAVRRNIIQAIEGMTGLQVVEVNIAVDDLRVAGDADEDADASPVTRVQ
ncbi:Asp23/Gls24 family envelope stress response protein [Streptomyces sp. NPDC021356]|uniref:Asp23/Gls24 family envelope stress response protein n=1 Tax=Streptomyces sp. NPDC021356 TaxID=3154900 RepID=UPI0033EF9A48